MSRKRPRFRRTASKTKSHAMIRPGAPPGMESHPERTEPPGKGEVVITRFDFGAERAEEQKIEDLDAFFASPRPGWAKVRWVHIEGLNPYVVNRFRKAYGFHTLNAEDVLHLRQRPRVERHADHFFIVAKMLQRIDDELCTRQVSFFLYGNTLLSFQEDHRGDVWEPVRQRIRSPGSILREQDAGFLLYTLLDAMIDHLFPVVEQYGDSLEEIEDSILERPDPKLAQELHETRREMVQLRRVIWPMRLMIHDLQSGEEDLLTSTTRTYLRDVHEHALQLIDIVETYRDMAGGLIELYLSSVSYRMNDIIKVLTIISTIFIPITFLAGVWGMNFQYMPELHTRWGYPVFWLICASLVVGLLAFFRRKGWIGR